MSKHSKIVNPSMEKCIPRFERDEVILGDLLGTGTCDGVTNEVSASSAHRPAHSFLTHCTTLHYIILYRRI
jgi:hypothetical protein